MTGQNKSEKERSIAQFSIFIDEVVEQLEIDDKI